MALWWSWRHDSEAVRCFPIFVVEMLNQGYVFIPWVGSFREDSIVLLTGTDYGKTQGNWHTVFQTFQELSGDVDNVATCSVTGYIQPHLISLPLLQLLLRHLLRNVTLQLLTVDLRVKLWRQCTGIAIRQDRVCPRLIKDWSSGWASLKLNLPTGRFLVLWKTCEVRQPAEINDCILCSTGPMLTSMSQAVNENYVLWFLKCI